MVISLADFALIRSEIQKQRVLVIGDIMLDRYVWGDTSRVSEEAPVIVLDVERKDERLGGAGNVVSNLVNLGCHVSLAGVVGEDFYGSKINDFLLRMGVNAGGVITVPGRPTTTKKRIIARGQQVLRVDTENRKPIPLTIEQKIKEQLISNFDNYDAVIVSDYAKGVMTPDLFSCLSSLAAKNNCHFHHRPIMVDPKPANRTFYRGLSIVKPNRREAESIVDYKINDLETARRAARQIKEQLGVEAVLLSLGGDGLLFYSDQYPDGVHSSTLAKKVFDVSGAGDAVVSCFTTAIAAGFSIDLAMSFANFAAANVVSEVGTIAVNLEVMQRELEYYHRASND